MNCHLDNEECIVTGRASRFPRSRRDTNGSSHAPHAHDITSQTHTMEEHAGSDTRRLSAPESVSGRSETTELRRESLVAPSPQVPLPTTTPQPLPTPHSLPPQPQTLPPLTQPAPYPTPPPGTNAVPGYNPTTMLHPWAYQQPLRMTSDVVYTYYPFLTITNLSNILPQDVNFLESQDCLRVPTRSIMNEFLQQYFLHVHPLLPLFNEGDFWDMYLQEGLEKLGVVRGRMSLLVLQSLLFATCNFVSRDSIKGLGFPSIRAARAGLYRRAKLLYDFESESSPISIAQAALLLSYWSPPAHSQGQGARKPNSNWLNIAIQHAKVAEAHHYPSIDTSTVANVKRQNILKRIWWCCVIRDRIMALCVRRTIQMTPAQFDFHAHRPLVPSDLEDEFGRSKVYDPETKRQLAEILKSLLDLCVLLTDVLLLVYPLDERPGWGRQMRDDDMGRLKAGREALASWYMRTSIDYPVFGSGLTDRSKGSQHDSVVLYTNLMYMYYHSSRVALCHHEVLHLTVAAAQSASTPTTSSSPSSIIANRQELQDAATGVTECLKELIVRRLARWLPISAMACTALPLVLHILDVKLTALTSPSHLPQGIPTGQAALKQHRLNILIEAMKTYQPQYDGVDKISDTIRHIVNLAQLDGGGDGGKIKDWTDILTSHPSLYLRLALTMDLSFSKDRLPVEGDFPASLRGLLGAGGGANTSSGPFAERERAKKEQRDKDMGGRPTTTTTGWTAVNGQQQQREKQTTTNTVQPLHTMKKWLETDRSMHFGVQNGLEMDLDDPPLSSTHRNDSTATDSSHTGSSSSSDQQNDQKASDGLFQPFTLEDMDVLESHLLDAFTLQNESPNSTEEAMGFFGRALGEDAAGEWFQQIGGREGEKGGAGEDDETARVLLEALKG